MADDVKQKVLEKLNHKAAVVQRVLSTPDGQELLRVLQIEFLGRLQGKDEHETVLNAGRADVVAYLMSLQRHNPEGR
jgi:hypothetical protein